MLSLKMAALGALALSVHACTFQLSYDGPGSNDAYLHVPPEGCETGPFSLSIANQTDLHLAVELDGVGIAFVDEAGSYDLLEPRATAFLCLEYTGDHAVSGQAYADRFGELVAVSPPDGDFIWEGTFGVAVGPSGRHAFIIDQSLLVYR
jgi:hypothetical protein